MQPTPPFQTDVQEGIIFPKRSRHDPLINPDVILALLKTDCDHLRNLSADKTLQRFDQGFFQGLIVQDPLGGPGFTVVGPLLGAPQAVMAMEKLISLGGRRFWVLGWCGSLLPDLSIGSLIIPTSAVSEEGTSRHYPLKTPECRADPELCACIAQDLHRKQRAFRQGPVWTTDAPFRETPDKIRSYGRQGVLAVEMEMSALFTVALFRSVQLAGLLAVSDELADLKWHPGFRKPELRRASETACQTILKCLNVF